MKWASEELFLTGNSYFDSLEKSFIAARHSIKLQTYIFSDDEIGRHIVNLLSDAARRGIKVMVIVDGVGAHDWETNFSKQLLDAGGHYLVYNRMLPRQGMFSLGFVKLLFSKLKRINNRAHSKLIIVDDALAYVGSRNICATHSERISGAQAFSDISVALTGEPVQELVSAFEYVWKGPRRWLSILQRHRKPYLSSGLVRLNLTRKQRRRSTKELYSLIRKANRRVWVTNGYFVPKPGLLAAFRSCVRRGIDIRLILSGVSDVPLINWATACFFRGMVQAGMPIYEYVTGVLHTKSIIIDDCALIGSTNMNHRSFLHDLELDVIVNKEETLKTLEERFLNDRIISQPVRLESQRYNAFQRAVGELLLMARSIL